MGHADRRLRAMSRVLVVLTVFLAAAVLTWLAFHIAAVDSRVSRDERSAEEVEQRLEEIRRAFDGPPIQITDPDRIRR